MNRIYYLMGKSASGKDTLYARLLERHPELHRIILYTSRPIRQGEAEGREYFFTDNDAIEAFRRAGKLIEARAYDTVHGIWTYATVDDGQIDLGKCAYLGIGTLESYVRLREYFGPEAVVPLYIYVEDGLRLERALVRERAQCEPKYAELCRRFLADQEDFSPEKLAAAGITGGFENVTLSECLAAIEKQMAVVL